MERPDRQIELQRDGSVDVACLRRRRLDEASIHAFGNEMLDAIEQRGCRWLVLDLGPGALECLYSVFLAKLVMIQRRLLDHGGALMLCGASPEVQAVFEACKLKDYFEFAPDRSAALAGMSKKIQS